MSTATRIRMLVREPLVHFALAGIAVFAVDSMIRDGTVPGRSETVRTIVVSDGFAHALSGRMPGVTDEEERIRRYLRDEALYREALRLGLDRGDAIVRRRLVQKMEFVLEGRVHVPEPTDRQLEAYLSAHADRFQNPPRLFLTHVFFSRDLRGEQARTEADAALETLRIQETDAPLRGAAAEVELGDPFLQGHLFESRSPTELQRIFGPEFAAAAGELPVEAWGGPIRSSYGWHLVRVRRREPGGMPSLADVRAEVARAWREDELTAARERAIGQLVGRYEVRRVPEVAP